MEFSQYFGVLPPMQFIKEPDTLLASFNIYSCDNETVSGILPDVKGSFGDWLIVTNFNTISRYADPDESGTIKELEPKIKTNEGSDLIFTPELSVSTDISHVEEVAVIKGAMYLFIKRPDYWELFQFNLSAIINEKMLEISQKATNNTLQIAINRSNHKGLKEIVYRDLYYGGVDGIKVADVALINANKIAVLEGDNIPRGEQFPDNPQNNLFIINKSTYHRLGLYVYENDNWIK